MMYIMFVKFSEKICFEEVMIILYLFIGYQPHICPKKPILVITCYFKKLTTLIF